MQTGPRAADNRESQRLDVALQRLELARSRSAAAALIRQSLVKVDGRLEQRPSTIVAPGQRIEIEASSESWVGRAALKLDRALDEFQIAPAARNCLDVGASTGGFTQVLLARGAASVISLDVGHDQLDPVIRSDPRVRVVEGFNIRELTRESLEAMSGGLPAPDLVVIDVSFISLSYVFPALARSLSSEVEIVALVKPQFEVGRGRSKGGIVLDSRARKQAVLEVLDSASDSGFEAIGLVSSPIEGSRGNREYLAWFSTARVAHPTEWKRRVDELD
ncbi:MAG: TlyA family RNA methyltransferase [Cryobacterium sp.]|nr:TlyA family RNA methyltransferase [Cryobacterium sp.]